MPHPRPRRRLIPDERDDLAAIVRDLDIIRNELSRAGYTLPAFHITWAIDAIHRKTDDPAPLGALPRKDAP